MSTESTSVKILNSNVGQNCNAPCRNQAAKHFFWNQKQNSPGGRDIY